MFDPAYPSWMIIGVLSGNVMIEGFPFRNVETCWFLVGDIVSPKFAHIAKLSTNKALYMIYKVSLIYHMYAELSNIL